MDARNDREVSFVFCLTLRVALALTCILSSLSWSLADDDDHACRIPSFPPRRSYPTGATTQSTQVIIPTMNFSGHGVIHSWTIFGSGTGRARKDAIELQLFKPNPTQPVLFTKVASTAVAVSIGRDSYSYGITGLDLTFSSGYVLGFYHLSTGNLFEVYNTRRYSTHKMLTSQNAVLRRTVIMASPPISQVPLMSVSAECMEDPHPPPESDEELADSRGLGRDSNAGVITAVILGAFVVAVVILAVFTAVVILIVGKKNREQNRIQEAEPAMYDTAVLTTEHAGGSGNKQIEIPEQYGKPPTYEESTRNHQEVRPTGYSNSLSMFAYSDFDCDDFPDFLLDQELGYHQTMGCGTDIDRTRIERRRPGPIPSTSSNSRRVSVEIHRGIEAGSSVEYLLHTPGVHGVSNRQPLPPIPSRAGMRRS